MGTHFTAWCGNKTLEILISIFLVLAAMGIFKAEPSAAAPEAPAISTAPSGGFVTSLLPSLSFFSLFFIWFLLQRILIYL